MKTTICIQCRTILLLAIMLPVIFACSYQFVVLVSDLHSSRPIFSFEKNNFVSTKGVKLKLLIVSAEQNGDPSYPVWAIRLEPGFEGTTVDRIEYGVVPSHFIEEIPAKSLKFDLTYEIGALSSDGGGGGKRFILLKE